MFFNFRCLNFTQTQLFCLWNWPKLKFVLFRNVRNEKVCNLRSLNFTKTHILLEVPFSDGSHFQGFFEWVGSSKVSKLKCHLLNWIILLGDENSVDFLANLIINLGIQFSIKIWFTLLSENFYIIHFYSWMWKVICGLAQTQFFSLEIQSSSKIPKLEKNSKNSLVSFYFTSALLFWRGKTKDARVRGQAAVEAGNLKTAKINTCFVSKKFTFLTW